MISIDATPSRALLATMAIAAGALMPNVSSAQQVSTCYTKQNGTVYRVGVPNTPATCTNPTHTLETWGAKVDGSGVLSLTNTNGLVAGGTIGAGSIPATGAGNRMMWYPAKAAFRAGTADATSWDAVNIGLSSFSAGKSTIASGEASAALGWSSKAIGKASFAGGSSSTASGEYSIALGVYANASGKNAVALGVQSSAEGNASFAFGANAHAKGEGSIVLGESAYATGFHATGIGVGVYAAGEGSVAMGQFIGTSSTAKGSFVFGDGTGDDWAPQMITTPNSFVARATGGVKFIVNGGGCSLPAGGGQWACSSSRLLKTNIADIDGEEVLAKLSTLPVQSWSYTAEGAARHIGPMAQDFHAAFKLGSDDTTIGVLDAAGVSLAGVKALEARTTQLTAENAALRSALAGLASRLAALEATAAAAERR